MSGHLGVDDDDRRAEHDVADLPRRGRPEALDGERSTHGDDRDPCLVSRFDERLRVDAVGFGSSSVRELRRPSQHAGDRVRIEPSSSVRSDRITTTDSYGQLGSGVADDRHEADAGTGASAEVVRQRQGVDRW